MKTHAELIAAHAAACDAVRNASNLRELLYCSRTECNAYLNALWQGVRTIERHDYTDAPTFGGPEPADTCEVWSWDQTHMIIGAAVDVWRIVPRDE
jgi:hypothetical protein